MGTLGIVSGVVVAQSGITLMARVLGQAGQPITRASLSTITYAVRDLTDAVAVQAAQPLTIAQVVYDDLRQSDPRWTRDSAYHPGPDRAWGYNFLATLPAGLFDDYDSDTGVVTHHEYQVDVKFTPVTGQPLVVPFRFRPVTTYHA